MVNGSIKEEELLGGTINNEFFNGLSAYEVAVKNGYVGTEQQWLSSLKGAKGDTGAQGIQGIKGDKGDTGASGYSPIKGVDYFTETEITNIENEVKNSITIPTKTSELTNDTNLVSDATYVHTDNNFSTEEKTKLTNLKDYDIYYQDGAIYINKGDD